MSKQNTNVSQPSPPNPFLDPVGFGSWGAMEQKTGIREKVAYYK